MCFAQIGPIWPLILQVSSCVLWYILASLIPIILTHSVPKCSKLVWRFPWSHLGFLKGFQTVLVGFFCVFFFVVGVVFFLPPGRRNLRAQDLARSTALRTNLFRFWPEVHRKAAALRQLTRVRVGGLRGPAGQTDPSKRLAEGPTGWQAGAAFAALTEQRQVHKGLGGQLGAV